jgi:hypothetical protein
VTYLNLKRTTLWFALHVVMTNLSQSLVCHVKIQVPKHDMLNAISLN